MRFSFARVPEGGIGGLYKDGESHAEFSMTCSCYQVAYRERGGRDRDLETMSDCPLFLSFSSKERVE